MPGRFRSYEYLCAPVTISRPLTLGSDFPAAFHSVSLGQRHARRNGARPLLAARQFAEPRRASARRHLAVRDGQRRPIHAPLLRRQIEQHLARRRRRAPDLRPHARRRHAAHRAHVERREVGVAHHHLYRRRRRVQFLHHRLRQRGARILAHFHLAGVDRDQCRSRRCAATRRSPPGPLPLAAAPRTAGLLRVDFVVQQHHDAAAQYREEIAPLHARPPFPAAA